APTLPDPDRFVEFGLNIFALSNRLCSTQAEKYMADQLLRTGLAVGAKLHAAPRATSQAEFRALATGALENLREAGYWLMMTRRAGLLDKLTKSDLEEICQSLLSVLTEYAKA